MIERENLAGLIPEPVTREIFQGVTESSAVLKAGRKLPNMTAKTQSINVLDMLPMAYWVDGDTGYKQTTKMAWDKKKIYAEELAVIVPIPEAVLDDSDYDIWGEVKPRLVDAMGQKIDDAILFGVNKPQTWRADILTTATSAGNVVTVGADLYQDILGENGVFAKVEADGFDVSGIMAAVGMKAKLRGLVDTTKQPIFKNIGGMQNESRYVLEGAPMDFPKNGAFDPTKALMIAGDFNQLVYAIRQDVTYKILTEATIVDPETKEVLFARDTILDEEKLAVIGEKEVREIMVRGSSLASEAAISNAMITEAITLGEPDEAARAKAKDSMIHEMSGKDVTRDVVDSANAVVVAAGTKLTAELIDTILASDAKEIRVRNNNVRGIEVEAIKEGDGIIESLAERIVGRVLAENIDDPATGERIASINDTVDEDMAKRIEKVRDHVSIRSVLTCKSQFGVCIKCYGRDLANQAEVEIGEAVGIIAAQSIGEPGTQLTMRTFHSGGVAGDDITQGLPRVEELFEARKPKHHAIIAEIEGRAEVEDSGKGMRKVTIVPDEGEAREYAIPYGARMAAKQGMHLKPGDKLTEGSINPHDILRVCGLQATQRYLVYEVQKVYKSQGVEINDKHIEVMVRQMLHKVKIEESGSTDFLPGEYIDINQFEAANTKAIEEDGEPAVAKPILLGITKASLATDSFMSAASFQETTRVLTDAAIKGKVDPLIGLKENVIIGKLIPAGTGMSRYRNLKIVDKDPKPVEEVAEETVETDTVEA